MQEVREKRGPAYSVYTYLDPDQHASIFAGAVATRNDAIGQSLDVVRDESKKMADNGRAKTTSITPHVSHRLLSAAL